MKSTCQPLTARPSLAGQRRASGMTAGSLCAVLSLCITLLGGLACPKEKDTAALKSEKDKLSYALGVNTANQLRKQSVDVDPELFSLGFKDAFSAKPTLLTGEQISTIIVTLQNELRRKMMEMQMRAQQMLADQNKREGEAFLAQNGTKERVVTLESNVSAAQEALVPNMHQLAAIVVSFKLDPRLTRGIYMGDRWVSPSTFTPAIQQSKTCTVEAKAYGVDARRSQTTISPKWIPEDPDRIKVEPDEGHHVTITILTAGESRLTVTNGGLSKTLTVKAEPYRETLKVTIRQ